MPARYTPSELPDFHRDFTWATHLNDIRWLARETKSAAGVHLLAELKCLLLFHAPSIVVSDTDILNSSLFHSIFHFNADRIRDAIKQGVIMPAYRDTSEGLTDLNARQSDRRANKDLYDRSEAFVAEWDDFVESEEVVVLNWSLAALAKRFADGVDEMIESGPLSEQEQMKLRAIVDEAVRADADGRLLFGNIWKQQVETGLHSPKDRVVQAIRAVHLVGPAKELKIDPSVSVDDASVDMINVAMDLSAGRTTLPVEPAEFLRLLPKAIIAPQTLRAIPFEDILEMQEIGRQLRYFGVLELLRRRPEVDALYLDYLAILRQYMDEIRAYMNAKMKAHTARRGAVQVNLEMWEWQGQLIKDFEAASNPNNLLSWRGWQFAAAVPVAAAVTDLGLVLMGAHPGRSLIFSSEVQVAALVAGPLGGLLGYREGRRRQAKLRQALGGTYTAEGSA